ncbi:class I SAM-dependent DNA methyltransferase [Polynucleobacter acidiphobus]|uniref:class I SAM-dependent DNA methyltransferase n=1 Tax=Polynucleobacter acidiphobus TaxID=556053 RepID=UPI000D3A2F30|nr:class I SAM-dependent methyltransferase [Polynucleobacter acidiphobus]
MIGIRTALKKFKFNYWQSGEVARRYHEATKSTSDYTSKITDEYLNILVTKLTRKSKILDLGCGTGAITRRLINYGHDVTAVDISLQMLEQLKASCQHETLKTIQGDIFALEALVEHGSFDAVATRWVIPHFPNWIAILPKVVDVLKPGGYFLFDIGSDDNYTIAQERFELDKHIFGYNDDNTKLGKNFYASSGIKELNSIANFANFEVVSINTFGFFRQNAIIASAARGYGFETYKEEFAKHYENPDVKKFVDWFDSLITPGFPYGMVNTLGVLLKKNPK